MSEYMHLIGTEEVSRAAGRMNEAAGEMNRASGNMGHELFVQRQFMDDWLQRFQTTLEEHRAATAPVPTVAPTRASLDTFWPAVIGMVVGIGVAAALGHLLFGVLGP